MATSSIPVAECDPCQVQKTYNKAVTLCMECREFYCQKCSSQHKSLKLTKTHKQIGIGPSDEAPVDGNKCDQCLSTGKTINAIAVCVECREIYCKACSTYHRTIKAARDHTIIDLVIRDKKQDEVRSKIQELRVSTPKQEFSAAQVRKSTRVGAPPSNVVVVDEKDAGTPLTACYTEEFSSRIPSDTKQGKCEVLRMVTLPDARVLVLDYNNSKLKLFSTDYKYMHHIDTPACPHGLTVVDQYTVAVSFAHPNNTIQVYTVHNNRLQKGNTVQCMDIDGKLFDIAYGDNQFAGLVNHGKTSERSVCRLSMDGHVTSLVREQETFTLQEYVAPGNNLCFYVSSDKPYQLKCLTYEGRFHWKVPIVARGITVVKGRVCVVNDGQVRQISLDGDMYDDVVLQGLTEPDDLCYQGRRNRLLVSSYVIGAAIKVYTVT